MALGLALQRYGDDIAEQQEVLVAIADIIIAAACAESALLRASVGRGQSGASACRCGGDLRQ